ncbi:hypothetical protein G9C85_06415 [Halorubellus sp. JP-L1]|uniref:plastocyanin/azurin family copper-binding protein n=1 Tax=Halorubellus sp. JP-L1 TaxID=2715753 RepID=UPI00140D576C|nr:plastocyanin/azurin family copper-binding protein [Halorubellus sp. JP-L1]NHN41270.1 hypothetical protein [Halorubellus sp. JP-L1]
MKALGAGTAAGALGWATLGAGDEGDAVAGIDEHTEAVHDVQTLISVPSTNPDRPADFFYEPTGLHVQPGDVVRWRFTTPDHNVVGMHPAFGMRRRVPTGVEAFSSPLLGFDPDTIPGDMIEPPAPPVAEGGGDGGEGEPTNATTATEMDETTTATEDATTTNANATTTTANATTTDANATMAEDATATTGAATADEQAGPTPDTWLLSFDTPGVYDIICSPHEAFGMAMRIVVGDETSAEFETSDPEALPEPRAGPVGLARVTLTDPALEPEAIVEEGTVSWSDLEANQSGDGGGEGEDGGEGDGGGEGEGDDGDDDEGTETGTTTSA